MTLPEFDAYVRTYNQKENIYRAYYETRNHPQKRKEFLAGLDQKTLEEQLILIPECIDMPKFMGEVRFEYTHNDIHMVKHDRYTPAFPHKHQFFEMFYVYDGQCTQSIGGRTITYHTGDLCILAPDVVHSISVFDDSIILNVLICSKTFNDAFFELLKGSNVLSDFFRNILFAPDKQNNYITFHTAGDPELKMLLSHMGIEDMHPRKYSRKIINHLLMLFFDNLLQNHEKDIEVPMATTTESRVMARIFVYIEDHYNDLSLERLAEEFHFSTAYLSRLIKSIAGKPFTAILRDIRMKHACEMLNESDMSISDIAAAAGYSSQEHFIRTFKKVYQCTPSSYRKHQHVAADKKE